MFFQGLSKKNRWKDCLSIFIGAGILTFGMYNIHGQTGVISEGGIFGLVLLIKHWTGLSASYLTLFFDGLCYLFGYKYLGRRFLVYSVMGTLSVSFFYALYEHLPYLLPNLTQQPLAAAIIGGMFVGFGVGLVVRVGAASGGDDALALILTKKFHWKISFCYVFTDFAVLFLSLSYIPLQRIFYSLITVTISSFFIGKVEDYSKNRQKMRNKKLLEQSQVLDRKS